MGDSPDFSGYATKADIVCSDGLTIAGGAFQHQDGEQVQLMWQHDHNSPQHVLGHVILKHAGDGMRCDAYFNDTPNGQISRQLVHAKDITNLSIYANRLKKAGSTVVHGMIKEVSLVLSGANKGAMIDYLALAHNEYADLDDQETLDEGAVIHTGLEIEVAEDTLEHKSMEEIYNGFSEEEKDVVLHMLREAISTNTAAHSDEGDGGTTIDNTDGTDAGNQDDTVVHQEGTQQMTSVFEAAGKTSGAQGDEGHTLSHSDFDEILTAAKRPGMTYKDALADFALSHADDYGITNIELLFPEARLVDNKPEWITRRMEWVSVVLNGVSKLPYSRIKSMSADLTHEEARAKGYIKGTLKKNQFFSLAGRETQPDTIYKKQQLDRDDIIDITELDVVAWIWSEMRFMLNEEIARAILVGDGREVDDPDKVKEDKIRPIAYDDEFYTDVVVIPVDATPEEMVDLVIEGRETYLGVGNPTAFMTRKTKNRMLLQRDGDKKRLYRTVADLCAELEVDRIVEVVIMDGMQHDDGDLLMVIVNLSDYYVGTTRGGEISTFDDFNIDYNQYQYLIEGRMSGALTRHKTAQVIVQAGGTLVNFDNSYTPTFNTGTGVLTVPNKTGVVYKNAETHATLSAGAQTAIAAGTTISVEAVPANDTYYFPHGVDTDWDYTRNA